MTIKRTDSGLQSRVGKLEVTVEGIAHELTKVSDSLDTMRDFITTRFEDISLKVENAGRPSGQTIASYAGIALTLVALFGTLIGFVFTGHGTAIDKLQATCDRLSDRESMDRQSLSQQINEFNGEAKARFDILTNELNRLRDRQDQRMHQLESRALDKIYGVDN